MNWVIFILIVWFSAGLDMGLRDLLRVGDSSIAPRFLLVLMVFVCLWAKPGALMLGALAIGLVLDTLPLLPAGEEGATLVIVGPFALGCLLAAYTILTVRSVMQRRSPFTLAALALLATLLVEVVRLTLLTVRGFYDDLALDGAVASLGVSAGIAVYTAVCALVLAPVLNLLRRPLKFQGSTGMGFVIQP